MKRAFDLAAALLGLVFFSPVFLLIAVAVKLDSPGPILYRGERVGKDGKRFAICKFRTMVVDAARLGGGLTHRDDPRVTRLGRFLRSAKLDEIPQLLNVLRGEMSLVGPRPEDPRYVALYTPRQRRVLSVRPGMTSLASLRFRNEEKLLPPGEWEKTYVGKILPAKLSLELDYLEHRSFIQDLSVLSASLLAFFDFPGAPERLARLSIRLDRWAAQYVSWFMIDIPLIVVAFLLGIGVRSVNAHISLPGAMIPAAGAVFVYLCCNFLFGIYNRYWRYASAQEAVVLFLSTVTATVALTVVELFLRERDLPLGALWMAGFFAFFLLTTARYRRRLFGGAHQLISTVPGFSRSGHGSRVLIVGAGEEGQLLAWQLQNVSRGSMFEPIGFVDDDPHKRGMRIHNVPVLGDRRDIPGIAAELKPDLIVISLPATRVREPDQLLALCRSTSAQVKVLPGLFEWLGSAGAAPRWDDVDEQRLLERAPYQVDEDACRALLTARVVMVTGAAGSIGSELCRQIAEFDPARLILLDINESGLHDLAVELRSSAPDLHFELALADISNTPRMTHFFKTFHPQIVFHAAAYKHVPMLESHPQEGIRVNVLGTRQLHELAMHYGVERFVLISSDKAVNPGNILGMTKWLGELLVTRPRLDSLMLSTVVRFGNVLGSRGSVIPTFQRQIDLGGPVTITHPDMTRYFLTIQEAVSLVIQAASMTRGGDVYVLDMGVPIRIMDLAERLIRANGLRPGVDIQIHPVGVRPGEKLNEELVARGEEQCKTEHPSIFRIARTLALDLEGFEGRLDALTAFSANGATPEAAAGKLRGLVSALEPSTDRPPSLATSESLV